MVLSFEFGSVLVSFVGRLVEVLAGWFLLGLGAV